jgi:hypothetical protein
LQEPQLHHDEEQKEAFGAFGNEEVLQYVPQANGAQGSEVAFGFAEERCRSVLVLGESSNG